MKVSQLPTAQRISGTGNKVVVNIDGTTSTVDAKTLVEAYAPQQSSPDLTGLATEAYVQNYVTTAISTALANLFNQNIVVDGTVTATGGFIFPAMAGEPQYKIVANGEGQISLETVL